MKRELYYELIHSDSQNNIWKVTDQDTRKYVTFTVSDVGEMNFTVTHRDFPYSDALREIAHREGRRLFMNISEANKSYKNILENTKNSTKVPCFSGISFQVYYLNP